MIYNTPTFEEVYIAPNAVVRGDVTLGRECNVWYGAVIRADMGKISVGALTAVEDNCVLHFNVKVGDGCVIGHGAIVHGCSIGDNTLIGMGSVILDGAKIPSNCLVGAGSLVTAKLDAPEGSLIMGSPAKVVRALSQAEIESTRRIARKYADSARQMVIDEAQQAGLQKG